MILSYVKSFNMNKTKFYTTELFINGYLYLQVYVHCAVFNLVLKYNRFTKKFTLVAMRYEK